MNRVSAHTTYQTEYHVVWETKYRRPLMTLARRQQLEALFSDILVMMPGCEILEQSIQPEHIHLLMVIPPKYAVKEVVGRLKGMTSSRMRKMYGLSTPFWSTGYYVSTVGVPEDKIQDYIRNQ